jgi:ABC-2 type transport system ATP-binding protein
MGHTIETAGLVRRFGRCEAVDGLDLHVLTGSIFGLIGPNGAGKTTTIKLLMNLLRPSAGRASVLGKDSRRLNSADFQRIGYVSENQRLPLWMSPTELLDFCRPLYPSWDDTLCRKLAADLRLSANAPLRALSRGTRMKAALLSSLAYHPDLIVLDEPFSGLDPLVRDELTRALLELAGERPCTVLISSHDIEELERLVDNVGYIDAGRLVFAEPVSTLLRRFRLIEVIAAEAAAPSLVAAPGWMKQEAAGRTLRFIDAQHDAPDADARIASAWPGAEIRSSPLSLREIFVALATQPASSERRA